MRKAGVLMPVSALPSRIGAGELGEAAFHFIELLKKNHVKIWQILPLNPVGYGNSPYQPYSSCAGDELYISLDTLAEEGLLKTKPEAFQENARKVDYEAVRAYREPFLREAFAAFTEKKGQEEAAYKEFTAQEWVYEYGVFRALKKANNGDCWNDWPEEYRTWPENRQELSAEVEAEAQYQMFLQYLFYTQWMTVKRAANEAGIEIMGDVPFYVGQDSVDVWGGKDNFLLDTDGRPIFIAGVPPDYFSATGQLWGNPLYDWDAHDCEGYQWWISRVKNQLQILDILRIDHFRGFEAYWAVPYGEPTAVNGQWQKGPEGKLFSAIQNALGESLPIIAEDLGVITPEVEALRDSFAFPGMKVLQFAFEDTGESSFLPHQFTTPNCVCYTGTHDNDTTLGWYETLRDDCKHKLRRYLHAVDTDTISLQLIRLCLSSTAAYAIFPLQDVLDIGKEGRMNMPGRAAGNWSWRFRSGLLTEDLARELRDMSQLYGRY